MSSDSEQLLCIEIELFRMFTWQVNCIQPLACIQRIIRKTNDTIWLWTKAKNPQTHILHPFNENLCPFLKHVLKALCHTLPTIPYFQGEGKQKRAKTKFAKVHLKGNVKRLTEQWMRASGAISQGSAKWSQRPGKHILTATLQRWWSEWVNSLFKLNIFTRK